MTVAQATDLLAQVHNWAVAAAGISADPRRVPVTPAIPLKRLVYALDVMAKANKKAPVHESTISALIVARSMRSGITVRTRRPDGMLVSLTLTGGPVS